MKFQVIWISGSFVIGFYFCNFKKNHPVYEISITLDNNVEKVYIGMTKRKLPVRIMEHRSDIKHRKQNTALCRFYLANEVCHINFDEAKIIIPCNNPFENKIRKSAEIIAGENKPYNDNLSHNIPKICIIS